MKRFLFYKLRTEGILSEVAFEKKRNNISLCSQITEESLSHYFKLQLLFNSDAWSPLKPQVMYSFLSHKSVEISTVIINRLFYLSLSPKLLLKLPSFLDIFFFGLVKYHSSATNYKYLQKGTSIKSVPLHVVVCEEVYAWH